MELTKTYKIVGGGRQLFKESEDAKSYKGVHAIDIIKSYLNGKKMVSFESEQQIISV
ncbi:hypothetical protein [Bacillus sp. V33-4]|uniref:hypothetical protein n=1 Tax=Bacillus sp. V33-4 TaxID=2054169 RepID=UPI002155908A|nr:hypothetical protein [Bacillus sp. V33-4]